MKKNLIIGIFSMSLLTTCVYADVLKNSLTNLMHTKDKSPVVDLGSINLNAKSKHHSKNDTIAIVDGNRLIKKDADKYLKQRTHGKIKDFDKISPQQQKILIREMAFPIVLLKVAKKELTADEIQNAYNNLWMQKTASKVNIKDDEARVIYDKIKQKSLDNNNTNPIPEFEVIKDRLKSQILEKRLIGNLMKDVTIKVAQ